MMNVFVLILFVTIGLAVVRFIRGPSDVDRIIALDILFSVAVAMCAFAALYTQRVLFLDIAIGVALIAFITTLAWSRLLEGHNATGSPMEHEE